MARKRKRLTPEEAYQQMREHFRFYAIDEKPFANVPDWREVIRYMDREFDSMRKKDKERLGEILTSNLTQEQVKRLEDDAGFLSVKGSDY